MADFPSFADLFRVARDEALGQNSLLTKDVIERDGSDANTLITAGVAAADECIGQLIKVEAGIFLDSAKAEKLDRLIYDRYGLTRKPAAPAIGSVEFTTTASTPSSFSIPINTRLQTVDGKTFLTTTSATFPMSSTGPISVPVRSSDAGASQQASANTITNLLDTITGAPSDLAVNNATATAGADDEEQDDAYRDRARRFFVTARRGTGAAIEAAALNVPGVRKATNFEALDMFGRPAKTSQLVISDAFTDVLVNVTPTPPTYQTQSQVLSALVFQSLSDTRPDGTFVDVILGQVILLSVHLVLSFQTGVDTDNVALQARAAIVNYTNALSPGATFRVVDAITALRTVAGLVVLGNEVVSPAGDVIPQPLQVLRTSMSFVSVIS